MVKGCARTSGLCLLLGFWLGTGLHGGNQELRKVTLQLSWHHQFQFAGYYAALEKGYYREAGLDVVFKEGGTNEEAVPVVLRGEAQFGVGGADLVQHWSEGHRIVVLAAVFQHSPLVLLAKQESGFQSVHDLVGKRIQLEANAAPLRALLKAEGILDRVHLLPHPGGAQALIRGEAEAMSAFTTDEPFELQQAGKAPVIFSPRSAGIDFYGDCLFTSEALLKQERPLVEAFRAASLRGWRYAMANQEEIVELIQKQHTTGHTAEQLRFEAKTMEPLLVPGLVEMGYTYPGRWNHILQTLEDLGLARRGVSLEGFLFKASAPPLPAWVRPVVASGLALGLVSSLVALAFFRLSRRARISEERFARIFQLSPDTISLSTLPEGRYLDVNQAFLDLTGFKREEVIGRTIRELGIWENEEIRSHVLADLESQAEIRDRELLFRMKDGRMRRALYSARRIQSGRMSLVLAMAKDISDRTRMEELLRYSQKAESIGLMAGSIAHDFNNVFQAVGANLELAANLQDAMERDRCLTRARQALRKAETLSRNLQEVSGHVLRRPSPLLLEQVVAHAFERLKGTCPPGVELSLDITPELPPLEADTIHLERVIEALLANAIEAADTGRVTVRLRAATPEDSKELGGHWILAAQGPAAQILEVEDVGIGMSADVLARAFDPFYSTRGKGRGLGLPTAMGLLRAQGAGIHVTSAPGTGTCVRLVFPAQDICEAENRPAAPSEKRIGTAVLLVDDDDELRTAVRGMLEQLLGLKVLEATNGLEALDQCAHPSAQIGLILMDATMPRMGGIEAYQLVRQRHPELPAVLCSGFSEQLGRETARQHGFSDFLAKPYSLAELRRVLVQTGLLNA